MQTGVIAVVGGAGKLGAAIASRLAKAACRVHAGALANSAAAKALTSILIFINRTYQVDGAGIRLIGELIKPAA